MTVYNVTYNKNGGTGTEPATEQYNAGTGVLVKQIIGVLTAPAGKVSAGWNTEANGTGTTYVAKTASVVPDFIISTDLTLYAKWITPTVPSAPQTLQVQSVADGSVTLVWQAPSDTGGASITNYTVINSNGPPTNTNNGYTLTKTVTGLTNGTTYVFSVIAINDVGSSSNSNSVPGIPAVPSAATALNAVASSYASNTGTITSDLNSGSNISSKLAAALAASKQNPAAYAAIASSNIAAAGELITLSTEDSAALREVLSISGSGSIKVAIPKDGVLPDYSTGTYFAAIPKTSIGQYSIAATADYLACDGNGNQYFNKITGVALAIGDILTLSSGKRVVIRNLGSVVFDEEPVVCFLGNAPVATPTGPKRIDALKEGDLVLTETGKSVPIQRVKVLRVRPGPNTNPYVIAKGQYGATEELLISPRHCVAVAGKMIEARDLGLPQKIMKKPFTYYNIELPGWANMRVAGVEVESLAPAKRVIATAAQVRAAIAAMKGPNTTETLKTLQRLCKKNPDGTFTVYGAMKA
jgi:hypothetical protein